MPKEATCFWSKLSKIKLDNYKLSTIANHFNIEQKNYHNALDDAFVCGKVFNYLIHLEQNIEVQPTLKKTEIKSYSKISNKVEPPFWYQVVPSFSIFLEIA